MIYRKRSLPLYKPRNPSPEKPSVIVGPYGHCLGPGHESSIVSTMNGYVVKGSKL